MGEFKTHCKQGATMYQMVAMLSLALLVLLLFFAWLGGSTENPDNLNWRALWTFVSILGVFALPSLILAIIGALEYGKSHEKDLERKNAALNNEVKLYKEMVRRISANVGDEIIKKAISGGE